MSGGTFSKSSLPQLPGSYFNWVATLPSVLPASIGGTVVVPFTSDWGPDSTLVSLGSIDDYRKVYGPNEATPGFLAVRQAFQGSGFNNEAGAGTVLGYRIGGSAKAKAVKTLQNTGAVNALTLTAIYNGAYGNNLRYTVQNKAGDSTKDQLLIYLGTVLVESYDYTDANLASLAAQINPNAQGIGGSAWVRANVLLDGTALAFVASTAATGGNDGSTLVSGDWTAVMSALETTQFGILAPFDLTDSSIQTALLAWLQGQNAGGHRFMTIIGGATDEAVSVAATRAASMNDGNVMTIGVGSVKDSWNGQILSTSQLVPRIAGVLAARGESQSMTFARLAGLTLLNGVTLAGESAAYAGGVIAMKMDSNATAPVKLTKALTTFTNTADPARPYLIYRNPKFMRTMQNFEAEMNQWFEDNIISSPNDDITKRAVVAEARGRLQAREVLRSVAPGSTADIDPSPPPTVLDEFVALALRWSFERSVEQVLTTAFVS